MNPQHPHIFHPYARVPSNMPNNAVPNPWMQFPVTRAEQEIIRLQEANFNLWQQVNALTGALKQAEALNKKLAFQQNQFLDLQSSLQLSKAYCAFMQNEYHKELQAKEQLMKELEEYKQRSAISSPIIGEHTQGDAPPVLSPNPYMKIKKEVVTRPSSPSVEADSGFEDTLGVMDPIVSQASGFMDAGQMALEETAAHTEIIPVDWSVLDGAPQNSAPLEAGPMYPMKQTPQVAMEETVSQEDWSPLNQNAPYFPMDQVPSVGMEVTLPSIEPEVPSPTVTQIPQDTVSTTSMEATVPHMPLPMMMYPMPFPTTPFAAACVFHHNSYAHLEKYQQYEIVWRLMPKEKKATLRLIMEKIRGIQNQQMLDGLIKYRRPSETSPFWRLAEGHNLRNGLETTGYV